MTESDIPEGLRRRFRDNPLLKERWEFMTTPPKLTPEQARFLEKYLDSLLYDKIDVRKLLKTLITTQVLRNPGRPKGGGIDLFCGHNRTLAYLLGPAETTIEYFYELYEMYEETR